APEKPGPDAVAAGRKVFAANCASCHGTDGLGNGEAARALSPSRTEDVWAIDGSVHRLAELLGVVSLTRMEGDQSELGFWIGAGFWNTGFATEAVEALVAANPHKARTLFAEAFQDNPGSARVLTNCGFVYLGDAESWSVARGARVATWTYLRRMG
ncbi:MAG: GNAT family N-acetyltransferase, partial [Paracoccus sp. (in: a-proteobacteria)]